MPMSFEFKVISTRSGSSILLSYLNKKYLFGCFEGFQRYCIESKVKMHSLNAIFITSKIQIPALIGVYLTSSENEKECLNLACTDISKVIFLKSKYFIPKRKTVVKFIKNFKDEYMDIRIIENNKNLINSDPIELDEDNIENYDENVLRNSENLNQNNNSHLKYENFGRCSFIIKLPILRGKFLVEKLDSEFPRKFIKKLINREKVEFNGKIYDGNDYLEKDEIPPKICIADSKFDISAVEDVKIFICFDIEIAKYLEKYKKEHIYLINNNPNFEFKDFYNLQKEYNQIFKNFLLPVNYKKDLINKGDQSEFILMNDSDKLVFKNSIFNHQINFKIENLTTKNCLEPPYVLFLGTGCAIPSKYRNVSGILVMFSNFSILLDCGEDTYSQISRVYGDCKILKTLKYIFISHSHADHHLGLSKILMNCNPNVRVFGPKRIELFIKSFVKCKFLPSGTAFKDGNLSITYCPVKHCRDSFGIRIDSEKSIVYSGDCRPDIRFINLSYNADLMIHEATFTDELVDQASKTSHSTISEALDVFKKSESTFLVLTHLSQRYKKSILTQKDVMIATDFYYYDFKSINENVIGKLKELNDE